MKHTAARQEILVSPLPESQSRRFARPAAACALALALAGASASAAETAGGAPYYDDTFAELEKDGDLTVLNGSYGYERYQYEDDADGQIEIIDARNADFIVANSMNSNPTYGMDCTQGSLPVNLYPVNVYYSDFTSVVGGLIYGEIPQESDWEPSYCNSAALQFRKGAADGTVDGIRITAAWDAMRMSTDSPRITVRNSWISNVRDDILEDDLFFDMRFEDNLVDGTYQGISVHSGGDRLYDPSVNVVLDGNVIRIREYLYKGDMRSGALFKSEETSPNNQVYNTVVAVDYEGGRTYGHMWEYGWNKMTDCSNNLFLWLSDDDIHPDIPLPPSCFTVVTGAAARDLWTQAKQNWIDCHPRVARLPSDPVSDPNACVANTWGGYSRAPELAPRPPTSLTIQ